MDEDVFDQMFEALHPVQHTRTTHTDKQQDGNPTAHTTKNPLDPNYFSKYYHQKLKTPFHLPRLRKHNK